MLVSPGTLSLACHFQKSPNSAYQPGYLCSNHSKSFSVCASIRQKFADQPTVKNCTVLCT
ncbi:Uncharacterised protein [Mycobacterium tuberculosis]|nr:Uncharacterised protein [Mycobacterium tuberculosis]